MADLIDNDLDAMNFLVGYKQFRKYHTPIPYNILLTGKTHTHTHLQRF